MTTKKHLISTRMLLAVAVLLTMAGCKAGSEFKIEDEYSATITYEIQFEKSELEGWFNQTQDAAESLAQQFDSSIDTSDLDMPDMPSSCEELMGEYSYDADIDEKPMKDGLHCVVTEDASYMLNSFDLTHEGDEWTLVSEGNDQGGTLAGAYSLIAGGLGLEQLSGFLNQELPITITMPANVTSVSWSQATINGPSVTFDALHTEFTDLVITAREGASPIGNPAGIKSIIEPYGGGLSTVAIVVIVLAGVAVVGIVIGVIVARSKRKAAFNAAHAVAYPQSTSTQPYVQGVPYMPTSGNVYEQSPIQDGSQAYNSAQNLAPMQAPQCDPAHAHNQSQAWQEYQRNYAEYQRNLADYQQQVSQQQTQLGQQQTQLGYQPFNNQNTGNSHMGNQ